MATLLNRNILIVGEENLETSAIEKLLYTQGATIIKLPCKSVTQSKIDELSVTLLILHYTEGDEDCMTMLNELRNKSLSAVVPIFMAVSDDDVSIQKALSMGATDYITPTDDPDSILQKISVVFSDSSVVTDGAAIDISSMKIKSARAGVRVFVVEDDPMLQNLLSIRLKAAAFPTEFSVNGENIVESLLQFKPDILILDLMLPGKSGFEIMEELNQNKELSGVPVIVFSNKDGQEDRRRADELGAAAFYVKAMTDLSELVEHIEDIVSK